jgi:hypothetical protein
LAQAVAAVAAAETLIQVIPLDLREVQLALEEMVEVGTTHTLQAAVVVEAVEQNRLELLVAAPLMAQQCRASEG